MDNKSLGAILALAAVAGYVIVKSSNLDSYFEGAVGTTEHTTPANVWPMEKPKVEASIPARAPQ